MNIKDNRLEPWIPITDPIELAILGKLGEEAGELSVRACRTIIQGWNGIDPKSGFRNKDELLHEIADVIASYRILETHINNFHSIARVDEKYVRFKSWHQKLRKLFGLAEFGVKK